MMSFVAAADAGDTATVTRLLDSGLSPDTSDMEGREAIWAATERERWVMVRLLIQRGAHNADRGDDMNDVESVAYALEQAGHRDWAEILRKRGYGY
jgi:ankyrin repeat protein